MMLMAVAMKLTFGLRQEIFVRDIQTDAVSETASVSQSWTIPYCQVPYWKRRAPQAKHRVDESSDLWFNALD